MLKHSLRLLKRWKIIVILGKLFREWFRKARRMEILSLTSSINLTSSKGRSLSCYVIPMKKINMENYFQWKSILIIMPILMLPCTMKARKKIIKKNMGNSIYACLRSLQSKKKKNESSTLRRIWR